MTRRSAIPRQVRHAVNDALQLIQGDESQVRPSDDGADPLPSLLEQCGAFASKPEDREPVRLIHHFACTGGTLITKCLACSPNTHVLSEVDPLSDMGLSGSRFAPSDMSRLVEYSNRAPGMEDKLNLFMASFEALYECDRNKGLRLLIRDHSHSHFCTGEKLRQRPTLAEIIGRRFKLRSIITVRHPLESYLSLIENGWETYTPSGPEEYAKRYKAFLSSYPDVTIFKYEDFLARPDELLQKMCTELKMEVPNEFRDLFMVHNFSGDSGRKGNVIEPRKRRWVPDDVMTAIEDSLAFRSLCQQLQYKI